MVRSHIFKYDLSGRDGMVLDKLGTSLRQVFSKVANALFVDDTLINELIKELQKALILADVNTKQVLDLTVRIKERIKNEPLAKGLTKKEQLMAVVYKELVAIVGGSKKELDLTHRPIYVLLVGLFGSGKTTSAAKLAKYYAKRGKKVALLGLDTFRPAAMTQLAQLAASINLPAFVNTEKEDPLSIYMQYKDQLDTFDIIFVDSSGRDALNKELIDEIKSIHSTVHPTHTLLVLSADIGQAAKTQASAFKEACGVTGLIVTKLDGTAKGGGALTASAVTGAPIYFIGVGEKVDDLEPFNPEGFIGRLLGMGDLSLLLEKVQGAIDQEQVKDLESRVLKGEFHLLDLYQQMEAMANMGSFSKIMEMVPGLGSLKLPQEALAVQEKKLVLWKVAMNSMTKKELEDPEIISGERIARIAKGSGVQDSDVRDLLKQYRQAKKMVKLLKGGDMQDPQKILQKLGKKNQFKVR